MQGIRFEHLSDDTEIKAIGSLFRRVNGSQWGINLGFYPSQRRKSMTVSNAPVLVRKRVLNSTTHHKQAGYRQVFTITDTKGWKVDTIGNCPMLEYTHPIEKEQLCFVFQAVNGLTVYLPQFELARALFLHDGYLSRTAMEPDCLKAEFDITVNSATNTALVNVMPTSSYPLISFNDPEVRRVLSWILIDSEARASYESIGQNQRLTATESRGYRQWNFRFDPPALPCSEFVVRGKFVSATNSIVVYEIKAIRNIQIDVPELVEFYHPRFEEQVTGSGSRGAGAGSEAASDYALDELEASADKGRSIYHPPPVEFKFASAFKTTKIADKKRAGATGRKDEQSESSGTLNASVEEATVSGSLQGAEWDSVNDTTDDAHLYSNKFDAFWQMLDCLQKDHNCVIVSHNLRKLPELPRCKKHLLKIDGNPRCMAVVELQSEGQLFQILEVDTSDEANALSTQLLHLNSPDRWGAELFEEIEKKLLRQSLRWPGDIFKRECGKGGYRGIPHPQTDGHGKGRISDTGIAQWAARFSRWLTPT